MSAESEKPVRFVSAVARVSAIIGVLVALAWPFAVSLFARGNGSSLTSVHDDLRKMAIEWSVVAVLAAIAFGLQRLSPRVLRLRGIGWRDVLFAFGGLVAALVLSGAVSGRVAAPKFDLRQLAQVPIALRVCLVLTAAICEEFIYRGFAIEELGALTGSRWIGALASLAFFALGHVRVYGFSTALLIPASVGLVITLLYMFRNNLPVCMLVHGGMDGLFLILVPALLHR
jgi:membrane protease YdiL (CAAX protease family)